MRSQNHLRRYEGVDSDGRCAFEFGESSALTPESQYIRSKDRGYNPPLPGGGVTFDFTRTAGTDTKRVIIGITGIDIDALVSFNWGDGSPVDVIRIGNLMDHTYATAGVKTIQATIAGVMVSRTFTAV